VLVTSPKTAEGFSNFSIKKNDVLFGDRGYSTARDIFHVNQNGGYVIVRMISILPLYNRPGERFEILQELRRLKTGETAEFGVLLKNGSHYLACRVCAIKKSHEAAEKSKKKIMRQASKHSFSPRESTLEFAEYVLVLTTLGDDVTCNEILEMYRMRWQVELAFKRLKSLLGLGHLKKTDQEGAKAWLHGKLFFAILIEVFNRAGEFFSPWGYSALGKTKESLA
jgi:IS4 transposase